MFLWLCGSSSSEDDETLPKLFCAGEMLPSSLDDIDSSTIWTHRMRTFSFLHNYSQTLHPIFALLFLVFEGSSTPHSLLRFDTDNSGAPSLTVDTVHYHPFQGATENFFVLIPFITKSAVCMHSHL